MVLAGMAADATSAADLVSRGADVVVLGTRDAPAAADGAGQAGGVPFGGWIAGNEDNEAKAYREAGFDFVVFDPESASATALLDEEVGYVVSLTSDLSDSDLRTIEAFQLDAVSIGAVGAKLTVRRQIDLRRVFSLTRKPLMATIDAATTVTELQALRDANVIVVACEGAANVERLRKAIDALPARAHRKDGDDRPTPLVPRASAPNEDDDDEHEHDHE